MLRTHRPDDYLSIPIIVGVVYPHIRAGIRLSNTSHLHLLRWVHCDSTCVFTHAIGFNYWHVQLFEVLQQLLRDSNISGK